MGLIYWTSEKMALSQNDIVEDVVEELIDNVVKVVKESGGWIEVS